MKIDGLPDSHNCCIEENTFRSTDVEKSRVIRISANLKNNDDTNKKVVDALFLLHAIRRFLCSMLSTTLKLLFC